MRLLLPLCLLSCARATTSPPADADQDGFPAGQDCDDADADAFPGGIEFCDGRDNDCDGEIDGPTWDARTWIEDGDGDGWGCADCSTVLACEAPPGHVGRAGDCDDADPDVRPERSELCNGRDDDCDGFTDIDSDELWYVDLDGDGSGDPATGIGTCSPEPGRVQDGQDCDDTRPDAHRGADEVCNNLDDDCDGLIDDLDAVPEPTQWYPDGDGDGHGSLAFLVGSCAPPPGPWSLLSDDCDDFDGGVYPAAPEVCDGVDQDCDGSPDTADAPFLPGVRAALTLTSPTAVRSAVAVTALEPAAHGASGSDVRVVLGDCASGYLELPARFVDAWDGLATPGADGDGLGAMVVVYETNGSAATEEVLLPGAHAGWLHFDAGVGPGDASASPSFLAGQRSELALDGLIASGLVGQGASVFDQLAWAPRVVTPAGNLTPAGLSALVVDDHPAVAGLSGEGIAQGGAGAVRFRVAWWRLAARSEIWARVDVLAESDLLLTDAVDWRRAVVGFAGGSADPLVVAGDTGVVPGFAVRVLERPASSELVALDGSWSVAGTDADGPISPSHTVSAGTHLASVGVVLSPVADASVRLAELDASVVLEIAAPPP